MATLERMNATLTNAITEKQFQQQIINLAQLFGWLTYHNPDSRRSTPGFPDLVLARNKTIIFAELKTTRGRTTKHQKRWAEHLPHHRTWRPDNWPEIEATLTQP